MTVFIFIDFDGAICSVSKTFQSGLEESLNLLCGVGFTKNNDEYFIYDNFHPSRLLYKGELTRKNLEDALNGALRCYPWEVLD